MAKKNTLRKDQVVNLVLDPRVTSLGSVGAALVAAAKKQ